MSSFQTSEKRWPRCCSSARLRLRSVILLLRVLMHVHLPAPNSGWTSESPGSPLKMQDEALDPVFYSGL